MIVLGQKLYLYVSQDGCSGINFSGWDALVFRKDLCCTLQGISIAAWLVTHLCISVSLATCLFFFRELANVVALGRWLRIPPPSCKFLLRCVLPCAGPVRAMISGMFYTDPTGSTTIFQRWSLVGLIFNLLWAIMQVPLDKAKCLIGFVCNVQDMWLPCMCRSSYREPPR